ncbi:MAG: glutathione synthase [Alphaproteobacteria bacterium]|nr:glutathione synthase [Alphaproteobacteria bacterium]
MLKIALQMDPIETINIKKDSTFLLGLEAQRRGYELFYYNPKNLSLEGKKLYATGHFISLYNNADKFVDLKSVEKIDLRTFNIILLRQDPPFDMAYITTTYFLERLHPKTLVVNNPLSVRSGPEKLLTMDFVDFIPPTLITSNTDDIISFRKEHKDIIIKPLYGNGGAGVFHIKSDDENFKVVLEFYGQFFKEPVVVQQYIPDVRSGDKRIILINGSAAGAINRIPPMGEVRSNMHIGGLPQATTLTKRDQEICEALKPMLKKQGLIFTGIDVIGNYLTEINITSPTGLHEINHFDHVHLERILWDSIEEVYTQTRSS